MMPVPGGAARKIDLARAMLAAHVMMQRAALAQRHLDQIALGGFGRLADRLGHFARLAVAETDPALLVADDDQRGKAEAPAALDHLGDAIDVNELVDELAVAIASRDLYLDGLVPRSILSEYPKSSDPPRGPRLRAP